MTGFKTSCGRASIRLNEQNLELDTFSAKYAVRTNICDRSHRLAHAHQSVYQRRFCRNKLYIYINKEYYSGIRKLPVVV